ncbi:MAG: DUF542 domain-containing protein [Gemmatimonadota bacterium]
MTTTRAVRIHADSTVHEIVRSHPATLAVFNEFGIHSCCGGGVAISVAAVSPAARRCI